MIVKNWLKRLFKPWITKQFHRYWYYSHIWEEHTYMGYNVKQLPFDLMLYQEIIFDRRPSYIVQTGVSLGGSIIFFAHILDAMQADSSAVVVGIDIKLTPEARTISHPRIHLIEGSSVDNQTIQAVENLLPNHNGMVSLDSDHSFEHVRQELQLYQQFVGLNQFLVAEDTNLNNHPVNSLFGPGPYEAVVEFLKTTDKFVQDDLWKKNMFSFHQYGWLRRVSE